MLELHQYYNGGIHGPKYGDLEWINEQVGLVPVMQQKALRTRYGEIYTELAQTDPNNARFRANSWLRKVVKKNRVIIDNK